MAEIKLLDTNTINQIAAGEVIDRPASILKELVENSIDAGADSVSIEIKGGGTDLIRITDNGSGISSEQVPTAFLRHATSKIQTASDLPLVMSLGFRGEALASIAAIADVELITKTKDAVIGTRYRISGGVELSNEEIGAPNGTTFIIRNVFDNVPVRKKFLKTTATEGAYCAETIERIAISHPEVSFKFKNNGRDIFFTKGNGKLNEMIFGIYGREIAAEMLETDYNSNGIHVYGTIAGPVVARSNRNTENFFVNGRYIRSAIISKAIEAAYQPFLMQHKYPFTCLYIDIDPLLMDVNVHPSKQEVRFENPEAVYLAVLDACTDTLKKKAHIHRFDTGERKKENRQGSVSADRAGHIINGTGVKTAGSGHDTINRSFDDEVNYSKPTVTGSNTGAVAGKQTENGRNTGAEVNKRRYEGGNSDADAYKRIDEDNIGAGAGKQTENGRNTGADADKQMFEGDNAVANAYKRTENDYNTGADADKQIFEGDNAVANAYKRTGNDYNTGAEVNKRTENGRNSGAGANRRTDNPAGVTAVSVSDNQRRAVSDESAASFENCESVDVSSRNVTDDETGYCSEKVGVSNRNVTDDETGYCSEKVGVSNRNVTDDEAGYCNETAGLITHAGAKNDNSYRNDYENEISCAAEDGIGVGEYADNKSESKTYNTDAENLPLPEPFENRRMEQLSFDFDIGDAKSGDHIDSASEFKTVFSKGYRIVGQVFKTYWIVECDGCMYMIDQHAAHEKIIYEKMMKELGTSNESQLLSPPLIVTLSAAEANAAEEYHEQLESFGFSLENFGGKEYALSSVPLNLYGLDARNLLFEILTELSTINTGEVLLSIKEKIATCSCKAAVKGNHEMSEPEARELLKKLLEAENPFNCPHGRPIIIDYSKYEIEKKFKRIV